ncbi:MAG: DNA cytosine methyltransferase [Bifidobacteriaceae bacterium]|jgi:DNA (cytosine-5)-methyltransferase 1|nr:DNA cytosine methyltransferase [Bifidobacteriaceae bacterium]
MPVKDKNFVSERELDTSYQSKFIALELFAGAGGLALGIEKAGFNTLSLIENNKDAANTLKKNRPNWNVICEDIMNISTENLLKKFNLEIGQLDLLSGGAPCQSFSYAGKRLGLEDARGTLFYSYAVFLKKLKPKTFLFENVKGLLTHDNGNTYKLILKIFANAGYTIQKKVLNFWNYGVPQKRERLITIGIRNDLTNKVKIHFPKPHIYKPVLRDILFNIPQSEGLNYADKKKNIYKLVPPGGCWRDIPKDVAKKYMKTCWNLPGGKTGILRRLSLDEPSLTILTTPSQKQTDRCHPMSERPFTVRETARIQSFPDNWKFVGSLMSKYRQIGNAVPVLFAYNIAKEIYLGLEML